LESGVFAGFIILPFMLSSITSIPRIAFLVSGPSHDIFGRAAVEAVAGMAIQPWI
jgi:hypothetical protein